jgi:hypothetical protein
MPTPELMKAVFGAQRHEVEVAGRKNVPSVRRAWGLPRVVISASFV